MKTFLEFVDRKERESKRQLKILGRLFDSQGFDTREHTSADDPYLYVSNPMKHASFDGIRIYRIGTTLAFRIQKEEKTHPFGRAYPLDVEEMFNDLLTDHHKPEEAGKALVKSIAEEVKLFFDRQARAENELKASLMVGDPKDPFNRIVIRATGTDYANLVTSKA